MNPTNFAQLVRKTQDSYNRAERQTAMARFKARRAEGAKREEFLAAADKHDARRIRYGQQLHKLACTA
jgi:hypothetical protein